MIAGEWMKNFDLLVNQTQRAVDLYHVLNKGIGVLPITVLIWRIQTVMEDGEW